MERQIDEKSEEGWNFNWKIFTFRKWFAAHKSSKTSLETELEKCQRLNEELRQENERQKRLTEQLEQRLRETEISHEKQVQVMVWKLLKTVAHL